MAKITAPEDEPTQEIGVQYPDGTTNWDPNLTIWSPEDRATFTSERNEALKVLGVSDDPGVVFLTRLRTVTFSTPTPIND